MALELTPKGVSKFEMACIGVSGEGKKEDDRRKVRGNL